MSSESAEESTDDAGVLTKATRGVVPRYTSHPDAEMDSIGWAIFLGVLVLFVPLLPFFVVVWVLERGISRLMGSRGD